MATSGLSNDTRNFQCVTVASVGVIKLPLRDILASHIQPKDLFQQIQSCSTLKLRQDQLKLCCIPPPDVPDINKFDVTLLYTLIRNLCSLPRPAQGWGNEPTAYDTQISDDIERLRLFRNNYYAHAESAGISDSVFKNVWKNLKLVFRRIQLKMGYSVDYEEELMNIERTKFTDDYLTTFRVLLETFAKLEKQTDGRDEPDIFIKGENEIICGNKAQIEAEVKKVESSCWSITWRKRRGDVIKCIDTDMEKYSGSTKKKLVIQSVCKEDEGEYQAILSNESNGPEYKSRNTIRLHAVGEIPFLTISKVSSGSEGITLHFNCEVLEQSPKVHLIEWSKNGKQLDNKSNKYVGEGIDSTHLTITSPTYEDRGNYNCKVSNAVGSVSKNVMLDVPSVKLLEVSPIFCGSKTTIKCVISSTPTPENIEWQTSRDGVDFHSMKKAKYFDNTDSSFVIHKATFADKLYYRLRVWNGIGETISNTVYVNVTGSPPNIKTIPETNIKNRSVKLIGNVIIYDDSPGVKNFFWSRNYKTIDFEECDERLSETRTDNPSLTITNVGPVDAGEYRLTAMNDVGSFTSEAIVLGAPRVFEEKVEDENNGSQRITVTIKSIPEPCHVQWSAKRKENDTFVPIDINAKEYEGTTVTLPHPVLFVKQKDQLENICFRIEVTNFIGNTQQDISGNYTTKQRKIDSVENTIYNDDGNFFEFTILSSSLVKQFPLEKLDRLKFLIKNTNKVKNLTSIKEATSVIECIEILQDENLFTPTDVIYMQFLCQEADCFDLFTKCVEYAESKQRALCYYKKTPVNGYKDVQFHVQGDVSGYTKDYINHVIKTVAVILRCKEEDVLLNGAQHSKSFLLSLSIKEPYVRTLLALEMKDRLKLRKLNIDYLIIDGEILDIEITIPKDSVFTKDLEYNFKDLLRCQLCYSPNPLFHCDICKLHLCKTCIGEHLSDKPKEHKVVSFISKRAKCITKCLKHTLEYCDNYCMECDIPVCAHCVSGFGHRGHKYIDMEEKLKIQKKILERDLQELENWIYPNYLDIASYIPVQKADLNKNTRKLTATIDKHGEDLHRKVDNVIRKLISDVYEIDTRYMYVLKEQENEIKRTISEITESIAYMKELLYSNEESLVSGYKSRNSKFRIFPPKLTVSLPRFTPKTINEEQIYQQFGSLSEFLIKKEERKPLLHEPRVITEVNTGNDSGVHSVSCVTDEHIWTCSCTDNIMRLSNLQGELVQSIKTKSGICPGGIAVTRSGELVYTDPKDRTVNIVKKSHLHTVIRLVLWSPYGVCCTSAGDLLVALVSDYLKQTKIVRFSGVRKKQTIKYNDKGISLFSSDSFIKHISENSNLDICVADNGAGAVVVVNQFGNLRFTYFGLSSLFTFFTTKGSFDPAGITTDSQSRILIADQNNQIIHILNKNGLFLRYIDNCNLQSPCGLSMDFRDNLFVSEFSTNKVKKIKYCI